MATYYENVLLSWIPGNYSSTPDKHGETPAVIIQHKFLYTVWYGWYNPFSIEHSDHPGWRVQIHSTGRTAQSCNKGCAITLGETISQGHAKTTLLLKRIWEAHAVDTHNNDLCSSAHVSKPAGSAEQGPLASSASDTSYETWCRSWTLGMSRVRTYFSISGTRMTYQIPRCLNTIEPNHYQTCLRLLDVVIFGSSPLIIDWVTYIHIILLKVIN